MITPPLHPPAAWFAQHFAARLRPERERLLREHLVSCPSCRDVYDRHALLARLDPRAPRAEQRLAAGLGLSRRPRLGGPVLVSLLAVSAAFLLHWRGASTGDVTTRGAGGEAVLVYQLGGQRPARAQGDVSQRAELGFAYSNPDGWPYLMIFGVDASGTIRWYHPGWTEGGASPTAISARPGLGPHELPEAVSHDLAPGPMRLLGLFARRPVSVAEVERLIAARAPWPAEFHVVEQALGVTP